MVPFPVDFWILYQMPHYLAKLTREIDLRLRSVIEESKLIFDRFLKSDLKLYLLKSSFDVSKERSLYDNLTEVNSFFHVAYF